MYRINETVHCESLEQSIAHSKHLDINNFYFYVISKAPVPKYAKNFKSPWLTLHNQHYKSAFVDEQ